ncbi:hypothetical protein THAOC_09301 [Thalassiosira oceanica]|uniref:Helicase C-terminal domain-containing protein n=1 Tax=Thalassiosira oceanica TaxID=159749 RepID=K0SSV6_THAOC|nr:hypothetical protein THAOC_09301 [Thalassiosira oceanica]|eukprot:EJK69443.1 hypothetical protein THAOC_09301 [Thalassiosira oceanica]
MCDEFNDPSSSLIAFLLSSKAGGCGLNLIGGNRLVLFDPYWNPAVDDVDKQAVGAVLDGQRRDALPIDSWQRVPSKRRRQQLSKEGLQSFVDDKEQVNALSTKDLRNLFKLRTGTPSDTHDTLKCKRYVQPQRSLPTSPMLKLLRSCLRTKLTACRELFIMRAAADEAVDDAWTMDFGTVVLKCLENDKISNILGFCTVQDLADIANAATPLADLGDGG